MRPQKRPNRLVNETSPYLIQHAYNPVDWFPWGQEALSKSRDESKPILLSIGYSACHWCHVMERESFEDENIARLMNENFVNIKVDREERPDLDQIYMNAVQLMTGHGGWPMTVFLTPEGLPFYGGTYFPPEDRHNMPGFPKILTAVSRAFREQKADITESSQSLLKEIGRLSSLPQTTVGAPDVNQLDRATNQFRRSYDEKHGGFGRAPKFPPSMALEFLLRTFHRTGDGDLLEIVVHTSRQMAEGGLYDQLGGGFHRYSTDAMWLVPHFEKMLYDNAQLSQWYLHLFQFTREPFFAGVATGTLNYVLREMTDKAGGFYSSQDADSEGHEGKFFVWSDQEVTETLGERDARIFKMRYGVTPEGNFEASNILNISATESEIAEALHITAQEVQQSIEAAREKLFLKREERIKPSRDEKILTSWNGLMITALAEAGVVLANPTYSSAAEKAADFILGNMPRNGLLLRSFKDGEARLNGYLEDYAFFIEGLISLFQTTGRPRWLNEATRLTDLMLHEFWDDENGGFFFTGISHERLIVRSKDLTDNATPSANSVAVEILLKLATILDRDDYRRRATAVLRLLNHQLNTYPSAFARLLQAQDFFLSEVKEIVVVGDNHSVLFEDLINEVWSSYLPNKVVVLSPSDSTNLPDIPLLRNRTSIGGAATAYVCLNYSCLAPTSDPAMLRKQLTSG